MSRILTPSLRELQAARDMFRQLLQIRAPEPQWQGFFSNNPFVFSRSLPLRLSPKDIVPLARPGMSEPDFIFYQKARHATPTYGIIELKRPDTHILTEPRKNTFILTRTAATALQQAQQYASSLVLPDSILFLGSGLFVFIIMGLSSELVTRLVGENVRTLHQQMPAGCQILPYDEILRRFESTLPPSILVLVPALEASPEKDEELPPGGRPRSRYLEDLSARWRDAKVLSGIRDARPEAISELRRACLAAARGLCRLRGIHDAKQVEELVEDVATESMLAVMRDDKIDAAAVLRGIDRVANRYTSRIYRHRARAAEMADAPTWIPDPTPLPIDRLDLTEQLRTLAHVVEVGLERLRHRHPRYAECCRHMIFPDQSPATPSASREAMRRAMRAFKEALLESGDHLELTVAPDERGLLRQLSASLASQTPGSMAAWLRDVSQYVTGGPNGRSTQ